MSRERDKKMVRWLVKNGYLEKEQAQDLFKKQSKVIKESGSVSFLKFLKKEKVLEASVIDEIDARLKKKSVKSKTVEVEEKGVSKSESVKTEEQGKAFDAGAPLEIDENDLEKLLESNAEELSTGSEDEPLTNVTEIETVNVDLQSIEKDENKSCPECQSKIPFSAKDCPICAAPLPKTFVVNCLVCHRLNDSKEKHCQFCGCNLKTGSAGAHTRKCKKCKNTLLPDEAFCTKCGTITFTKIDKQMPLSGKLLLLFFLLLGYSGISYALWDLNNQQAILKRKETDLYSLNALEAPPLVIEFGEKQKVLLMTALKEFKNNDFENVVKLLEDNRKDCDAHLIQLLAATYRELGQMDTLKKLQKQYPGEVVLKEYVAEVLFQNAKNMALSDRIRQAKKDMERCVLLMPNIAEYQFWAGVLAFGMEEYIQSERYFIKASKLGDRRAEWHLFMHLLNLRRGDTARSTEQLKLFEEKNESPDEYRNLLVEIAKKYRN